MNSTRDSRATVGSRRAAGLLITLFASGCVPGSSPDAGDAASAPGSSPEKVRRLVMVSVRSASPDEIESWIADGTLDPDGPLARMTSAGSWTRLRPIASATTGPDEATWLTGASPGRHGIVGNAFRLRADPGEERWFSNAAPSVETIWEAARRQGLRVARFGSLIRAGSDPTAAPDRSAPQAEPVSAPARLTLRAEGAGGELEPVGDSRWPWETEPATTPRWSLLGGEAGGAARLRWTLADGTQVDSVAGDWVPVAGPEAGSGLWAFVEDVDEERDEATIFVRSAFRRLGGAPGTGAEEDFPPGWPSLDLWTAGEIADEVLVDELHRESDFVVRGVVDLLGTGSGPELVLADLPLVLRHDYAFLHPEDPLHAGVAPEVAERRARWRREALREVDRHLERIEARLRPGEVLLVSSGYSSAPALRRVAPAAVLDREELRTATGEAALLWSSSRPSLSLYLNRGAGVADPGPIEQAEALFRSLADPATGEPVVERTVRFEKLRTVGLDHEDHGPDLWVQLKPGWVFAERPMEGEFDDSPRFHGDHGWSPEAGSGFVGLLGAERTAAPRPARAEDVAVTAAALLGIEPPRGAEGADVFAPAGGSSR